MVSESSKDSDQVGHLTSLNVTVIFLQLAYGSKGLPRSKIGESLSTVFQSYRDNGRVIMGGSVQ